MARGPSAEEIVGELIKALIEDPSIIGNKLPLISEDVTEEYHKFMLPDARNPDQWLFVSAKRPEKRPETLPSGAMCHSGGGGLGGMISMMGGGGGTDMVIYTFENEGWEDADHELIGTITYEFGEVIDIHFKVSW